MYQPAAGIPGLKTFAVGPKPGYYIGKVLWLLIDLQKPQNFSTSNDLHYTILLLNITSECTLHSKNKESITHNSIIILSSREDQDVNVDFHSTVLCKTIILFKSFSEYNFKWSLRIIDVYTYIKSSTVGPQLSESPLSEPSVIQL